MIRSALLFKNPHNTLNISFGHKCFQNAVSSIFFRWRAWGGGGGLLSLQFPLPTISGISGSVPVKGLEYGINDLPMGSFV